MKRWFLALLFLAAALAPPTRAALAGPAAQTPATGSLFALRGTPHLWVAGDDGALHWVGDTRALVGHAVNWSSRSEVTLDVLRGYTRGDPWLSTGLVKIGDPIYLAKWEIDFNAPTLLQVQSAADLELFGITAANYGALVLDKPAWEQRYGLSADTLPRGVLVAATILATPTPAPLPTATATPQLTLKVTASAVVKDTKAHTFTTTVTVDGAQPGTMLTISLKGREYICAPDCTDTRPGQWGPAPFGPADQSGHAVFTDTHTQYSEYTYTVVDPYGNTATIRLDDDAKLV